MLACRGGPCSRSAGLESVLGHSTESWHGRQGQGFLPVQEQGMLDRPAGMWAPVLQPRFNPRKGYLQCMIIFSLVSLSAFSLTSVVSAPSPPFSPSSHRLLTPLSACKTREKVRKRKKPVKPAGRLVRGRQSWASALGELLLGGFS